MIEADGYLDVVAGRIVSPAVIVVEGERIAAINPAARPAGAKTIALPGHTLLPGLMDAHVHLNYIIGEGWETEPVRFTAGDFALRAVPHAEKTLLAGFTTVRDLGTGLGFSDVALMHAIDKGWVTGPRVIPAGHALSITGGHCDQSMGFAPGVEPPGFVSGAADGVDEVAEGRAPPDQARREGHQDLRDRRRAFVRGPGRARSSTRSRNCARRPRRRTATA